MITAPPPVNWNSWLKLGIAKTTLLRSMENALLKEVALTGRTLDIGGGKGFDYISGLNVVGTLESVNIAASLDPTFVADLNDPLPIANGAYDNVLCFNTLEHVFDEHMLLREMLRILKPNGRFIITVPFLFKRHGTYGDFHRHTADYWERALVALGQHSSDFVIQPLVWCPLSSGLSSLPWFRAGIRGRATKLIVLSFELLRSFLRMSGESKLNYNDWALGFYIDGRRAYNKE